MVGNFLYALNFVSDGCSWPGRDFLFILSIFLLIKSKFMFNNAFFFDKRCIFACLLPIV